MSKFICPRLGSDNFHFDKDSNVLSGYLSDMKVKPVFDRLYPDACDVGLSIVSKRTGAAKTFRLYKTDGTEDIDGWWFNDVDGGTLRVLIIND